MAGHNRWTKVKHKKAAMGATKGVAFSKASKELTAAARAGGGDPANNYRLRSAIEAARQVNMPADTITRAIKRGTGELEGVNYEEIRYEGYGPGGVAVIVECLSDNRNRTAGEIRALFNKSGGQLGETNSVAFSFERKGVIEIKPGPSEDEVFELAIEAGASDMVSQGEDGFEVFTEFTQVHTVAAALIEAGLALGESKASFVPLNQVKVEGDMAKTVLKLLDALEENDDVQNVFSNAEFDDEELESLMA